MAARTPYGTGVRGQLDTAITQAIAAAAGCGRCKGECCPCTLAALAILVTAIRGVLGREGG